MAAYLVVIAHVDDRAAFMSTYAPAAAALVARMGGQYLLRAPGALGLEGDGWQGASVVISQWPDMSALNAFWHSEEYARIRQLRDGIARCQVLALDSPDAVPPSGEAMVSDRAAAIADIVEAGERWKLSYAAGDMAALRDLYEPDCLVSPNGAPLLKGVESVIDHFARHARNGNRVEVVSRIESIEIDGAYGFQMLRYAMTIRAPGSELRTVEGRTLIVYRRGGDGRWRVWRDMDNSLAPAVPSIVSP